ncbi:MAG: MerR family transcriptional regulator [Stygiobacter sp.]|nr:MAG: MerR family transcriptional regulator [Stygiobacter sp.]
MLVLKPGKNRAGNRIYTNKDIKLILQIKQLLREEKYTIEGAKKILDELNFENVVSAPKEAEADKKKIIPQKSYKKDLEDIKNLLLFIQSSL